YINENLCHYDKIEVLLERAEIGDLLFFKQDTSKKNISNIGFYIGDLKMLYFDNQHKKVCVTNLNENTKLTSSLVGIKNIENFSRTIQPPEKTK
ncbi:MAG: C40 family peptidase, partial [Clostridia bacterium]|nr:C40 family peptidase [Clostridia bacterium]